MKYFAPLPFLLSLLFFVPQASSAGDSAKPGRAGSSPVLAEATRELSARRGTNKFGHHALSMVVHINAPPHLVWEAIRENRNADPDVEYSKFTRLSDSERLLEQKYVAIPIFGATTCVLKLAEEAGHRIDYNLLSSDRLREFEGSWILSEQEGGTMLELQNHLKLNLPVPQRVIDAFAEPKMRSRLVFVKKLAESKHKIHIASNE